MIAANERGVVKEKDLRKWNKRNITKIKIKRTRKATLKVNL